MSALVSGAPETKDIARRLGLSYHTVRTHLDHAFEKLGVNNRTDAALKWVREGHDMTKLTVAEVFGPTVQGEGPSAGQRAAFVRLGRCNLDCAWCDTPFTWDWQGKNGVTYDPAVELRDVTVADVVAKVRDMRVGLVVVTGGEPMLQRSGLTALVTEFQLQSDPPRVEIETNGTQVPWRALWPAQFNVSPKLASSGVDRARAWKQDAVEALRMSGRALFKFVIGSDEDIRDVETFVAVYSIDPSSVWLMQQSPFGSSALPDLTAREVAEYAIERGWNFTDRLHVRLWGQERGR